MIVGTRKLLPFIFAMVLTFPVVYSQKGYVPGYVILNNGDTIYGRIKDRDLSRDMLYPKIRIRGEHSGRRKYSPYQVRGYSLGDSEFDAKWFMEDAAFFRFNYFCREGTGRSEILSKWWIFIILTACGNEKAIQEPESPPGSCILYGQT